MRKTSHSRNLGRASRREMLVELLRAFAQRAAVENRGNLPPVHEKLRTINALALQIIFAQSKDSARRKKRARPAPQRKPAVPYRPISPEAAIAEAR